MTSSSAGRKTIGILTLIIIFTGVLVLLAILPQLRQIRKTTIEIAGNKQELSRLAQELQGYKTLAVELQGVEAEKVKLTEMFPKREAMVGLVEGLETAAANSGVEHKLTITDRQENPETTKLISSPSVVLGLRQIEEVPFVLELTGNYRQILDFLIYFENLNFMSEFLSFAVTAESEQNEFTESLVNTGKAAAKIEGRFFIRQ